MRGIHRVIIQNKRIRYDFELRRNLTILRGDSATGKTTLIDMIQEYTDSGADSSIELICDKTCYVLSGATWRGQLTEMKDCIVFIDEGNPFVLTDEFAAMIQSTDNYYVIVSREGLPNLPYSVTEIYGIRQSEHYGGLKRHYNEFYRLYGADTLNSVVHPEVIITEDSNAGYQFFQGICRGSNVRCVSASGKSNLLAAASLEKSEKSVLIIADGAAFGPEMDRVMHYIRGYENTFVYVPESFEWLILSANPLKDLEIQMVLESPSDYIESKEYISWERFFTKLLVTRTDGTYLQYSKSHLNPSYLKGTVKESIMRQMEKIQF